MQILQISWRHIHTTNKRPESHTSKRMLLFRRRIRWWSAGNVLRNARFSVRNVQREGRRAGMIEIIGIILMMLGIAIFGGFIAYVIGDFKSIKEVIKYCLLVTIAVTLIVVGYYLMTGGE